MVPVSTAVRDARAAIRFFRSGTRPAFPGGHSEPAPMPYGYLHTLVFEGHLYVIISRQKESVDVLRVALSELHEP